MYQLDYEEVFIMSL